MANRKNLSVSAEAYTALADEKREGESFTDVVLRLCAGEDSEGESDPDGDAFDLSGDVLTESHLDDIASRTARKTADEVENRLSRR